MGRPQFAQAGTRGNNEAVAVSNRPELEVIETIQSTSIASGSGEITDVYAPSGSVYQLNALNIHIDADPDWASGSHIVSLRGAAMKNGQAIQGKSDYTTRLRWQFSEWRNANQTQIPSDTMASLYAMKDIRADENQPMKFKYTNNADAAQDQDREYRLTVLEESY